MSPVELAAAGLTGLSVLLTVRRSLWLWPTGVAGTSLYLAVFWSAQLYFSAALQVFFLAFQAYGWWWWTDKRAGRARPVSRLGHARTLTLLAAALSVSLATGFVAGSVTPARLPLPDALIAGLSVTAQLLLARKIFESWYFWILVDLLAVGVYASQALHFTAALYGGLLLMAIWGLLEWRRTLQPA